MNVSLHKPPAAAPKAALPPLPKVNVRPAGADHAQSLPSLPQTGGLPANGLIAPALAANASHLLRRRPHWDAKFALGLMALVILVNVSLTLLLGGEKTPADAPQAFLEPLPAEAAPQAGATSSREAKVFISGEDKRVLLRQLNTVPVAEPVKPKAEPGTYRAMEDAAALSLRGTGRTQAERE